MASHFACMVLRGRDLCAGRGGGLLRYPSRARMGVLRSGRAMHVEPATQSGAVGAHRGLTGWGHDAAQPLAGVSPRIPKRRRQSVTFGPSQGRRGMPAARRPTRVNLGRRHDVAGSISYTLIQRRLRHRGHATRARRPLPGTFTTETCARSTTSWVGVSTKAIRHVERGRRPGLDVHWRDAGARFPVPGASLNTGRR